ncbi:GLPGLI family protein [uncultured Nonlabens sp.]|uniref:GLPGLI family protein n=1 Tax=uncultured Nonlabens sp. TaxID=859306 RepID=UPI00261DCF87|nr:GLPGLI family protein [uncultured Nonlabens sp.]
MKSIVSVLIILFLNFNSHDVDLHVTYKVIHKIDKQSKLDRLYSDMFDSYETIHKELQFDLFINENTSVFQVRNKLYSDIDAASTVMNRVGYTGRFQQFKTHFIEEELEEEFGQFLIKGFYPEWVLTQEVKTIDSYTCFKAIYSYDVITPDKKVFNKFITAWYTPQIPYSFGPIGFGKLPGLIMELETNYAIYGVEKLSFSNSKSDKKMPELKKLKIITEKQLDSLAIEFEKQN